MYATNKISPIIKFLNISSLLLVSYTILFTASLWYHYLILNKINIDLHVYLILSGIYKFLASSRDWNWKKLTGEKAVNIGAFSVTNRNLINLLF